jgi:hypothetical protein
MLGSSLMVPLLRMCVFLLAALCSLSWKEGSVLIVHTLCSEAWVSNVTMICYISKPTVFLIKLVSSTYLG